MFGASPRTGPERVAQAPSWVRYGNLSRVPENRAIGLAFVVIAALLLVAAPVSVWLFGWPTAGYDGPSNSELLLERAVVTAPLWSALLCLSLAAITLASVQAERS